MIKQDVKNLNLILEKLNLLKRARLQILVKHSGLDQQLLVEKLIPRLINRGCITKRLITSNDIYEYYIADIGKDYLAEKIFQKEYDQEQRSNKEVKLLNWRIKTYWLHWGLTLLALRMSAYSIFIK